MALAPAGVQLVVEGADEFKRQLDNADKATSGFADNLGKLGSIAGGAAVVGVAALGGALVTAGAALSQVSEQAAIARNALQGVGDVNYDALLNDASLLSARYGVDFQETVNATRVLMDEFGLSSTEANDLIVAGFERGLNTSGDFLESLGEYSNLFADSGASAEELFSLLESGMAGGVLGTDKAADLYKEFFIRIQDGSKTTGDALAQLGLEDITAQLSSGALTASEAFPIIQDAIAGIEDPLLQAQLGVALFGTQFEDLGSSASLAIDLTTSSMEGISETADAGRNSIASLGEIGPRVWGALVASLLPVNDAILGFVNAIIGADDPLAELGNQLNAVGQAIMTWATESLPGLVAGAAEMGAALIQWVVDAAPGLLENLLTLRNQLITWVVDSLPEWGAQLAQLGQAAIQWVVDALPGLGTNLGQLVALVISSAGQLIADVGPKLIELGAQFVVWVATEVLPKLPGQLVTIGAALLTGIGNFIVEIAPEIGKLAAQFVDWVKDEVLPKLPGQLASIGTDIVAGIGKFIENVKTEAAKVGTAVVDGIKNGVSSAWSTFERWIGEQIAKIPEPIRKALGIASPSRVMAERVGKPITEGIASGMLDNVQILIDAARDISSSVLDEAAKLAADLQGVLGPILAESFSAAANFARSRAGGVAALDALFPSNSDLNRRAENLVKLRNELVALQRTRTDTSARKSVTTDRDKALRDERASLAEELREIDAERSRLQVTARQNIDPQKRLQAEEKLIDLNQKRSEVIAESARREKEIRDKAAADLVKANNAIAKAEADRQKRIQDLTRQLGAETNEYDRQAKAFLEQEQIAIRAQQEIAAAQQQANQIEDPEGRAAFFALRQKQILELAKLEQERAADIDGFRRQSFDRQIELTREAQRFEFQAFEEQQAQRRRQQQQALTEAGDAIKQLRDLVFFSQQDVNGVGSEALRGIANGIIAETANLSATLTASLNEVMAAARAALGIASPSKVSAALIGAPLAQGIASGFAAEVPTVAAQLSAQVTALVQPVASAASIVTNNIRTQSSSTTFSIDARGAAPGVERNIVGAIKQAQNLAGARSDIIRRMA